MNELAITQSAHDLAIRAKAVYYLETLGIGQDCTKKQLEVFIEIAVAYGLDPFKNEIYASVVKNKLTPMVGYPVYIKRAERTGKLDGWEVKISGEVVKTKAEQYGQMRTIIDRDKSTLTATITIYRKDRSIPFVYEVGIDEFCGASSNWVDKPKFMLKKTAIAHGFRWCFPDELGGMPYTEEEYDVIDIDPSVGRTPPPEDKQELIMDARITKELHEKLKTAYASLHDIGINQSTIDEWALASINTTDYATCKHNINMTEYLNLLREKYIQLRPATHTEPEPEPDKPVDNMTADEIDAEIETGMDIEYPTNEVRIKARDKYPDKAKLLEHLRERRTKRLAKQAAKQQGAV